MGYPVHWLEMAAVVLCGIIVASGAYSSKLLAVSRNPGFVGVEWYLVGRFTILAIFSGSPILCIPLLVMLITRFMTRTKSDPMDAVQLHADEKAPSQPESATADDEPETWCAGLDTIDAYLDDELSADKSQEFRAHLQGCTICGPEVARRRRDGETDELQSHLEEWGPLIRGIYTGTTPAIRRTGIRDHLRTCADCRGYQTRYLARRDRVRDIIDPDEE